MTQHNDHIRLRFDRVVIVHDRIKRILEA
jgi:hypothetical protein